MRITDHADEEAVDDGLTFEEIYFAVMHGEVIEDYPNDTPYPSCLILDEYAGMAKSRNESIIAAYCSGGYTLQQIGDYFALHYSTVSRIVHRGMQI